MLDYRDEHEEYYGELGAEGTADMGIDQAEEFEKQ